MNKKILVFGNRGMLGHVVERYLKQKPSYDIIGFNRSNFDASNINDVVTKISMLNPDIIINCIGALNTNDNINDHATLNVVLPRLLANMKSKLIHISTNCVFKNIGPHTTYDEITANDIYGMSKALGEIDDDKNLTIRCSMTGPELKSGTGLFEWFINQSSDKITGYTNALWNGVTTLELSKFIDECMMYNRTGLIQYYTKKEINKADVLEILNKLYKLNKIIKRVKNDKVHISLLEGKFFTEKTIEEQFKELKEWYK